MPCLQCENNLWKFGETGSCQYESKSQCDEANADYYNDIDHDYHFHFTQEMMEELHGNGELVVLVEEDEKEMVVKFTYGNEEVETEDYEIGDDEIMDLAKELKEINNKYKKNS